MSTPHVNANLNGVVMDLRGSEYYVQNMNGYSVKVRYRAYLYDNRRDTYFVDFNDEVQLAGRGRSSDVAYVGAWAPDGNSAPSRYYFHLVAVQHETPPAPARLPLNTSVAAGSACPQTGTWKAQKTNHIQHFNKNVIMKKYQKSSTWILTSYK